ncbi:zf-TFIIB domain-containing protein [bacterium]|nr:zf-TFIIB domain-containing protein [bacterium]
MKCPACVNDLTEKMVDDILVVVCDGGCGGIWFDLYELKRVNETHAGKGRGLLHVRKDKNIRADHTARRMCPRCYGTMMMKHFHSSKRHVEVDECPKCGGYWLDAGDLAGIHETAATDEERRAAAQAFFSDLKSEKFQVMVSRSRDSMEKRKRIARIFRFLCGTDCFTGSEEWGNF